MSAARSPPGTLADRSARDRPQNIQDIFDLPEVALEVILESLDCFGLQSEVCPASLRHLEVILESLIASADSGFGYARDRRPVGRLRPAEALRRGVLRR